MPRIINSDLDFLTTRETATILRLSSRTLEGMRRTGKGPMFTRLGIDQNSKVVYRRKDIALWLRGKRHMQVAPRLSRIVGPPSSSTPPSPPSHLSFPVDAPTADRSADETWITLWLAQTDAEA